MKKLLLAAALLFAALPAQAQDYYKGPGPFTINVSGIATTSTDGLTLANTTAATAGVPVQISPRLRLSGTAYNSVSTLSETDDWFMEDLPVTNAGATSSLLKFGRTLAGGAATYPMTVGSGGALTTLGGIVSGGNINSAGTGAIFWGGRAVMRSPVDGIVLLANQAETGFTRLIFGTNDATTNGASWNLNAGVFEAKTGDASAFSGIKVGAFTGAGGNLVLSTPGGKFTTYNGLNTAGVGLSTIYGENISGTQTSNFTALSYTPPATAGRYEVSAVITTTSSTNTGTVQVTVDYVDSQGTVHTGDIMALMDASGVVATTKTGASKEFHTLPWKITINNAATAIVIKVVITGAVSYTVSPLIEQKG